MRHAFPLTPRLKNLLSFLNENNFSFFSLILLISLLMYSILGCTDQTAYQFVDFSKKAKEASFQKKDNVKKLVRVAVSAMISPKETLSFYQALLDYIGEKLDYNVQLIQRKTYGEVNELFLKGQIDLAFICSGPYAIGRERYGFEALVTPVIRGEPFYQSYLIVHKDSPFQNLESLRGNDFAFTDPESNSGALIPQYWINQLKERPESFFKSITYTYSHDNSIMAIARSLIDGAAVDGHKWEYYHHKDSPYISKTRVIKKSIPIGSPPLVASTLLSEAQKDAIQKVYLTMHRDPEGKKILKGLLIDRFIVTDDSWYDPVRMMAGVVHGSEKTIHASKKP